MTLRPHQQGAYGNYYSKSFFLAYLVGGEFVDFKPVVICGLLTPETYTPRWTHDRIIDGAPEALANTSVEHLFDLTASFGLYFCLCSYCVGNWCTAVSSLKVLTVDDLDHYLPKLCT